MIFLTKKEFLSRVKKNFIKLIPFIYTFFLALLALRLYEFLLFKNNSPEDSIKFSYLFGGILIDFLFANFFIIICGTFISFFHVFEIKKGYIIHILNLIALLLNFILTSVFLVTFEPLDEVFYTFTSKELNIIIGLDSFDYMVIPKILTLLSIYFVCFYYISKININKSKKIIFASITGLCLLGIFSINYKSDKHLSTKLVNNKLVYFSIHSYEYLLEPAPVKTIGFGKIDKEFLGGKSLDLEYPLVHHFAENSQFADLFKISSKKPPNLVFIIVESLSTNFVGKYGKKTGNIMPYLDSLSTKSIYFPNIISTAERTYNVLPALLSSTPNAPEKSTFMDLQYPDHLSMMKILNKQYFSRFYCGVYLDYDNMKNYMSYHKTDYLVNNWEKEFDENFSKENIWGHPDDQLFEKSILDLKKKHSNLNKSRLDIFLTISTHYPFIFPDKEKIVKGLKKEISKIKQKTDIQNYILEHPDDFASFRFTDNCIRTFFTKMKKRKDYDNTIFVILGDHGTNIYSTGYMSKISTPLLIVSNLIKKPKKFEALSSHLDIMPSILSLLSKNYKIQIPVNVPFMGKGLRLEKKFSSQLHQPISTFDHLNKYMVYDRYFLYYDQLFTIDKNLELIPNNNEKIITKLKNKLIKYNQLSTSCLLNNKLINKKTIPLLFENPNFALERMYRFSDFSKNDDFINISKPLIIEKGQKGFKFELILKVFLKSKSDILNIPNLVSNLKQIKNKEYWKTVKPKIEGFFLKNNWNTIIYTCEYDPIEIKISKKVTLDYHLLNPNKIMLKAKNLIVKLFLKKQT